MLNFLVVAIFTFLPLSISTNTSPQPAPVNPPMKTEAMKKEIPEVVPSEPVFEEGELSYEGMFVKTMLALLSILMFVALCVWLFKRMTQSRIGQMNYHKTIKVLETRPISPKTLLYLVEVGDRKILLSESQLDVRQLTTLDFPEENHEP